MSGILPPYTVLACSAVFFWSISVRALIYTLMPAIAADLRLSSTMAGVSIASLLLGYCAGNWATGWLPGSRKGRILAGVLMSLPAVVLVASAGGFWMLLGAAALAGFGLGMYLPLGLALIIGSGATGGRAGYMVVHEVSATLGSFSGSSFVAVGLAWSDWRGSLLLWCAVAVLALILFAPVRDRDGDRSKRVRGQPVPIGRTLAYCVTVYAATTLLVVGLISVLPLVMVRAWGLDQAYAASVVGYTRLAGLAGVAAAGLFGDRLGHARMLRGFQVLALAGGVAMSINGFGPLFLVGMLAMAVGASGAILLLSLVIAAAFSTGQRERVLAVSSSVGGFLAMVVSPAVFGALIDAGLPTGPIVVASAVTLLAFLATGRIAARPAE